MNLKLIYRIASYTAFMIIVIFMVSSLTSEFLGDHILIANVKKTIFCTLPLLIICMIVTNISARKLNQLYSNVQYNELVVNQVKYAGLNGVLFLLPLATVLNYLAQNNKINSIFYFLQFLEIFFGLMNIIIFIRIFIVEKKLKDKIYDK